MRRPKAHFDSTGVDRAALLLADLKETATAARPADEFARRAADIGARHSQKRQFMSRLTKAGILAG